MQTVELTEFSLLQEVNHLGSRAASGIVQTVELTEFSLLQEVNHLGSLAASGTTVAARLKTICGSFQLLQEANHLGSLAASGIVQTVELTEFSTLTGGKPSWKSGCFWYCADCRVV